MVITIFGLFVVVFFLEFSIYRYISYFGSRKCCGIDVEWCTMIVGSKRIRIFEKRLSSRGENWFWKFLDDFFCFLKFQNLIENSLKISKNRKSENFRKIEKSIFSLKIFENRKIENFEFSKKSKIFAEQFSKSIFSTTSESFFKNPDALKKYDDILSIRDA